MSKVYVPTQLVRWCPIASIWQPADELMCNWIHDGSGLGRMHRLRLRRMYVCPTCLRAAPKELAEHDCDESERHY